jgi:hypothetical protein
MPPTRRLFWTPLLQLSPCNPPAALRPILDNRQKQLDALRQFPIGQSIEPTQGIGSK